jgi:hypothetical protein
MKIAIIGPDGHSIAAVALSGSIGRLTVAFAAVVGISGLLVSPVRAEQPSSELEGHRWWAEVGLGYGRVERSAQPGTLRNDSFAFNIAGGLRVSPHVKVGLDLGGYNLQSTCLSTPSHLCTGSELQRGKGLEHLFIVADYRPAVHDGWVLRAGLGGSGYWDQSVSQYYNRDNSYGWGGELGAGYTWLAGSAAHLGLRAGYEFGHLGGSGGAGIPAFDYSALKVTLVCAYY